MREQTVEKGDLWTQQSSGEKEYLDWRLKVRECATGWKNRSDTAAEGVIESG